MADAAQFRFRPRYGGMARAAIGVGAALLGAAFAFGLSGASFSFAIACGVAGVALGGLYLASPAWRYLARVGDDGLEVLDHRRDRKFLLAWNDIDRVIASPSTKTLVVSGGTAERTLIVPGPGAPAPYDIERKPALYDAIMARVPGDRVVEVALLEQYEKQTGG